MTSETTAKKDIQKLQRAIVDGLEDVKAQEIVVFNTEHLSPLFERVIIASGTSNRQTKALAASVRDAVREAGFDKPRIEGEENGEWIIVDCGAAVAHVMQPVIRQYYRLEEIWGATPVRLKHGAPKPAQAAAPAKKSARKAAAPVKAVAAKTVARSAAKSAAKTAAAAPAPQAGLKPAAKTSSRTAAKSTAKPPVARTAAAKTSSPRKTGTAAKTGETLQKLVVKPRSAPKPAAKSARPAAKAAPKAAAKAATKPAAKKKA